MERRQHRVANDRCDNELLQAFVFALPPDHWAVAELRNARRKLSAVHRFDHQRGIQPPTLGATDLCILLPRSPEERHLPATPGTAGIEPATNGDQRCGV